MYSILTFPISGRSLFAVSFFLKMAGMTRTLLSEYYGFGSDGRFDKSLCSHSAVNNSEISPDEFESSNPKQNEEEADHTTKYNSNKGDENIANKSDVGDLLMEQQQRSSRVLREETLTKEDTSDENFGMFLEANSNMNDYVFKNEKSQGKDDESLANTDKSQLKPVEEIQDINSATLEETASELRSNISSPMPKKRLSRKLKTSVMPLPPPPKKVPICNGVYLDLTSTGISIFPLNMLDKFPNLKMLYLENNNLRELPNELFPSLRFLHWLDVRNNQLTNLPTNIAWHPCLETILLQGNRIERLPLELCQVPKLKGLQTMHNPLLFPPKDVVARGCAAILEYLRHEWERLHPEEVIKPKKLNEQEKELGEVKPELTTILCYKPKSILKKKKAPDQLPEILSLTSTSSSDVNINEKTVRQKSWDYKPSNRCSSEGVNDTTAMRLMWISKVKEMLGTQTLALQRMKDREVLQGWRQDKSSFDKSIEKASKRSAENIPFGIDLNTIPMISKQDSKMQKYKKGRKGRRGIIPPTNINQKMQELFESLSQLQLARQSEPLSPRTEQKLLEIEIRKISDLQHEVQSLKCYNDSIVAPLIETHNVPRKHIERPPSFII